MRVCCVRSFPLFPSHRNAESYRPRMSRKKTRRGRYLSLSSYFRLSYLSSLSFLQVVELNLDNCKAMAVDGLTDEFVNLEVLSLNNVGLTSLRHFPKLPKLRKVKQIA